MKKPFRIIPRVTKDGDALLFLPDITANRGNIVCYARIGEHSESCARYYVNDTKPANADAMALAQWYIRVRCESDESVKICKRWVR